MKKTIRGFATVLALAFIVIVTSGSGAKGGNTAVPARATFRDVNGDRIGSDTLGPYANGVYSINGVEYCGSSRVSSSSYFLRTVNYACLPSQNKRFITLNFSSPVGPPAGQCVVNDPDNTGETLNICGLNAVPDVRLLADLFSSNALASGTSVVLPFSLQPEFTGGADFELDFEQAVSVTAQDSNTRILTAGPNAVAQLYQMVGTGGRKISLGRFYMPFQLTVTKLQ